MSLFLISDQQLFASSLPANSNLKNKKTKVNTQDENALLEFHFERSIKKTNEGSHVLKQQSRNYTEYNYLLRTIKQRYYLIERLRMNGGKKTIEMVLQLTTSSGTLFRIQNMNSFVQNIHQFTVLPEKDQLKFINLSVNLNNGFISARLPTLYLFNHYIEVSPMKIQNKIYKLFHYQIEQSLPLFEKILASNKIQKPYFSESLEKDMIWTNIFRYNEMINITSHLNESYLASESQIRKNNKAKQINIKRLMKYRKPVQACILKNNLLLQTQNFITNGIPQTEKDFQLTPEEQEFAHFIIAIPINEVNKNSVENNMILNYIHIKNDMNSLQANKVNEGGFASIYFAEVKCQYVYSFEGEEEVKNKIKNKKQPNSNELKKFVMVKKSTNKQHEHRITHQIQILKEMKNGAAIFLPKYYLAINQGCFFSNAILMDYIAFKNLKQYLQFNSVTISLMSKLFLIFSITQSLRFLKDYQIVHLDLKSANIMIFFNLLIKLIDFGESFHPAVCEEKHVPGYTIPYSSPQVYFSSESEQNDFTSKSDVYSLGVIMYEILYNHLPFRSSLNTQMNDNIMENYFSRWYMMPQQLETRGQVKIMRLMNMLISKCLRPRPKDRPELDWIALIIRQCLDLIH